MAVGINIGQVIIAGDTKLNVDTPELKPFCIAVLVYDQLEVTKNCINSILTHTAPPFEIAVLDNGSDFATKEYLRSIKSNIIHIYREEKNVGVTKGYNILFDYVKNNYEYVALLNNDIIIEEKNWNNILLNEIRDKPNVAMVGPIQEYGRLTSEMMGTNRFPDNPTLDYMETSCAIVNTKIINKHLPRLYDSKYLIYGFCEDSDFTLRLRNLGYEIKEVRVGVRHLHNVTIGALKDPAIYQYELRNRAVIKDRWEHFIAGKPPLRILVDRTAAMGDVLMIEPIIRELKYKYPYSEIYVNTACPTPLAHVDNIHELRMDLTYKYPRTFFDKIIMLDFAYENTPMRHVIDSYAEQSGVVLDVGEERIPRYSSKLKWTGKDSKRLAVCSEGSWTSRTWNLKKWQAFLRKLKERGYEITEVGTNNYMGVGENKINSISLHDTAKIIANSEMFLGFDGGLMHIAQAVGTPVFIIFGCTCPNYRIHDWSKAKVVWINEDELKCAGCHHKAPPPRSHTVCVESKIYCLENITEEMVETVFDGEFGNITKPLKDTSEEIKVIDIDERIFKNLTHTKPYVVSTTSPIVQHIQNRNKRNITGVAVLIGTYRKIVTINMQVSVLNTEGQLIYAQFFPVRDVSDNSYITFKFQKPIITGPYFALKFSNFPVEGTIFHNSIALFVEETNHLLQEIDYGGGRRYGRINMEVF